MECQRTKVSSCDVSRNFFCSRWAFPPVQSSLLIGWPFYNSKSSKPNKSGNPVEKKIKRLLGTFELLSEFLILLMQWPDLVFAVVLIRTLLLSVKMRLLTLFLLRSVALSSLFWLCSMPRLLLRLLLLLLLRLSITSYSSNLWRPT